MKASRQEFKHVGTKGGGARKAVNGTNIFVLNNRAINTKVGEGGTITKQMRRISNSSTI